MSSPHYKLHYFSLRARGEPIRLLLHYLDQPFEDVTFSFQEWASIKPTMPLRQVPVLEVTLPNGQTVKISQTTAILRYVAKKHGQFNRWR
ncbi:CRE-GST-36 protein [Aphelenchoides avenae]|nr:CRE-GST-36 protein [Aphelenchus avenae]